MLRVDPAAIFEIDDPFRAGLANPVLTRVPPEAARITAQEGLFSLHANPQVPWVPGGPHAAHVVFNVPGSAKPFFRQVLNVCGFNRAKLMSDLEGLCGTLAWRYRTR